VALSLLLVSCLIPASMAEGPDRESGEPTADEGLFVQDVMDVEEWMPTHPPAPHQSTEATVQLRFPLLLSDYWTNTAYFDLDPVSGVLDWDCQAHAYNGHNANDIAIRDFVQQEQGVFVLAAAPGTVVSTHDGEFDWQMSADPGAIGNHVIVEHEDGTQTRYWHLRNRSVLVTPGEQVLEGQPLGQIGSSGISTGPHLHFAVNVAGQDVEPHAGGCNPGASLWRDPLPHALTNPTELAGSGVSGLDLSNADVKTRPAQVTHIASEGLYTRVDFWAQLRHLHVGDQLDVYWYAPGGALHELDAYTQTYSAGMMNLRQDTLLLGTQVGTYTAEFRINGVPVASHDFEFDNTPYELPVAEGRTVPVTRGVFRGDLRASDADGDIKNFRLATPPAHGTVGFSGAPPRFRQFTYVPDSGYSGTDTFEFYARDGQRVDGNPAVMTMNVSPVVANVLRLRGEDDHVAIPDNGSLNLTTGLTLEAWVRRTTGSAGWNLLFDRRNPTDATGFSLGIQPDSTLRFGLGYGTDARFASGTTIIPMHRWTHVAATWDGSMMRLFVDGVEEPGAVPYSGSVSYPGSYETWLGGSRDAGNSFRGEIDEMRIWNEARTATQMEQDATCSFHASPPPASLVGWWRFEGDAQDGSAQQNHGSLVDPALSLPVFWWAPGTFPACAELDTDLDGIADDVDNCSHVANVPQLDTDLDGLGDACDGCPGLFDPFQVDSDLDGIPDACDSCLFVGNTDQADADGDGTGDLCDPDPANAAVGLPAAIASLQLAHDPVTGATTLGWAADSLAESYQVIRGDRAQLRARHYGSCVSGADPDPTDTQFVDSDTPAPGELFAYVVVGVGAGDAQGQTGLDSDGRRRDMRTKDCP
jgi:hypothetical protein